MKSTTTQIRESKQNGGMNLQKGKSTKTFGPQQTHTMNTIEAKENCQDYSKRSKSQILGGFRK